MSFFPPSSDEAGHVAPGGDITIFGAAELKTRLIEPLHQSPGLEIDLSGVSELDCAGAQAMLLRQIQPVSPASCYAS